MVGQRIGYVRGGSLDQNSQRQLDGVRLDRIFTDKASGRARNAPSLMNCCASSVMATRCLCTADGLARNLDDLRSLVQQLTKKGIQIEFLKENPTFTGEDSPLANLMLSVMGAFAEFERALIGER